MSHDEQWKRWSKQFRWLRGSHKAAKCAVCADFCCRNPQKSQLLQHEKGRRHAASGSGTPSRETFLKMLDERQKHVSLRKASAGRSKTLKMMWCTNEAIKDIFKLRIRKGVTGSITQDGQGATLSVRMCSISRHRHLSSFMTGRGLIHRLSLTKLCLSCCMLTGSFFVPDEPRR